MTKSELFSAAHAAAKTATDISYRAAFSAALRAAYAARRTPTFTAPVIAGCIRGGSSGSHAWVARITGRDNRYGLARAFIRADGHISRSGRSGSFAWTLPAPGFYEIRDVQHDAGSASIGRLDSGFIRVAADGSMARVGKAAVLAAL